MHHPLRVSGVDARLPVLFVDSDVVEWLPAGGGRHLSRPVEGQGHKKVAEAAALLVAASGERARTCVLALGSSFLRHRLLTLPELSRREARAVLQRKAALIAECDVEQVAFSAVDFGLVPSGETRSTTPEHRWLIVAMQRAVVREICHELRLAGLRVQRVVSAHLSSLAVAQALRSDREKACIVVSAHTKTTSVSVLSGDVLAAENVLEGNVRTQPALSMSIVQEIRSNDAGWRKAHRGGAIEEVVLLGLPVDRVPLFKTAVQTALPNARVTTTLDLEARPAAGDDVDHGRVEMLDACRRQGAFQIDMTIPLPPRLAAVVTAWIVLVATIGTAGVVGFRSLRAREAAERTALAELSRRTQDLERLRGANDRLETELASLAALTARNELVLQDGWKLREVLGDVLRAFSGRAELMGVTLGSRSEGSTIQVVGSTSVDPARAIENVEHVVGALQAGAVFGPTSAEPAGGVPDGREPITFTLRSTEEARP